MLATFDLFQSVVGGTVFNGGLWIDLGLLMQRLFHLRRSLQAIAKLSKHHTNVCKSILILIAISAHFRDVLLLLSACGSPETPDIQEWRQPVCLSKYKIITTGQQERSYFPSVTVSLSKLVKFVA